ncbi:hypothetical protein ACHAXR_011210 [Thalassiosira sp. AJA248-18]
MIMLQHALRRRPVRRSRCEAVINPILSNIIASSSRGRTYSQALAFSSQSNISGDDACGKKGSENSGDKNRVPRTLYRQLLSWCRRYDSTPFNPLPPMTLTPPTVNSLSLKRLKEMRTFLEANEITYPNHDFDDMASFGGTARHPAHYAMYKDDVVVKENMITFPEIKDSNQLRAIIRTIYWLNNQNTISSIEGLDYADKNSADDTKEQISLAFDAIKNCNQLSSGELHSRRNKREYNIRVRGGGQSENEEHPTVEYHVGQVVKHGRKKWRGVVVGWQIKKEEENKGSQLGSLTTKQYSFTPVEKSDKEDDDSSTAPDAKVQYTVLVDLNDSQSDSYDFDESTLLGKPITLEKQVDLSPVDDPSLLRVHNSLIQQYFTKFDAKGHFGTGVDADANVENTDESKSPVEFQNSRLAIVRGVREIGNRLLLPLSESNEEEQEEADDDALLLLSSLKSSLQSMMIDDVSSKKHNSAILSLAKLYNFHVKVNALLWTRKSNRQHKQDIKYSLGQIVKHKVYGFRGVVSAWDRTPRVDVSKWDGLKDIESPQEKPFYHLYPDVNDCISAFGGPRHYRYVCEENLELSPHNRQPLELSADLDHHEEWKWDAERGQYVPSAEMKFMYAEDLGENENTLITAVRNLRKILTDCLLDIRDGDDNDLFSMDDLFCQLQSGAENLEDATVVQDLIKEIWKESSPNNPQSSYLRDQLDEGILLLVEGKYESALDTFSKIVASDPLYGEAWNKKATVHYMMGEKDNSIKAAEEALKIDHRNFQALAGIGLIEMDSSHYDKAIESFRKCLDIHPWLVTVSSRLSRCMSKKDSGFSK